MRKILKILKILKYLKYENAEIIEKEIWKPRNNNFKEDRKAVRRRTSGANGDKCKKNKSRIKSATSSAGRTKKYFAKAGLGSNDENI